MKILNDAVSLIKVAYNIPLNALRLPTKNKQYEKLTRKNLPANR
jgi:hypothetical protein